jgi:two-component system, OmpR family, phosphate regulon sensor histidine kinase PhoR
MRGATVRIVVLGVLAAVLVGGMLSALLPVLGLPAWLVSLLCLLASLSLLAAWIYFLLIRRVQRVYKEFRTFHDQKLGLGATPLPQDPLAGIESAFQQLSKRLEREVAQLREMESYQRKFIADVSHELRTPIFAIQGYVETLLDGALDDKSVNRKFLKQTQKNVERLSNLVNELLVLSQLESGELSMNAENFKLYDLVLDVFELLDYKRTQKDRDVMLKLDAHGLESQYVFADKDRIKQVLVNLIENGIKYGKPDGLVRVELLGTNGKVTVRIVDDGAGIPPEHLPHIFERFYRVDKSRSRENGGTGIGLSIVKNLVEAHNETIQVTSELGRGTTFEFKLSKGR